ncbi:hypothetical protein EVAR_83326_1 [Eumeta japonica]|uniref:Uncharacterized protein n=1 Tax=Eumeta variegata TaxID=151549 RepID=A0A4C1VUJ6_EUMVA|nr:hypothetical protein EVAR_83326_1 [Eumeta japonica]
MTHSMIRDTRRWMRSRSKLCYWDALPRDIILRVVRFGLYKIGWNLPADDVFHYFREKGGKCAKLQVDEYESSYFLRKRDYKSAFPGIRDHTEKVQRFMWAIPGGTAMPGRPVTGVERAPNTPSGYKNQFNILVPRCGNFQILS